MFIFLPPEDEPRRTDEAVTRTASGNEAVDEPSGQREAAPEQPFGVAARSQSQTGGASGAATQGVGVAN